VQVKVNHWYQQRLWEILPLVSATPVENLPLVSTTTAVNFPTGTTGVVDTDGQFAEVGDP
jgi:hypothetical protein